MVGAGRKAEVKFSGQALLSEDFLRSEGVADCNGYVCAPDTDPPRLAWPTARPAGP